MKYLKLALAITALVAALPFLAGCVPAVIATGATVGLMSAQDRRSTGVQTDDEGIEWKAAQSVPERYSQASHLNFTSFNQRLLITGEVPSEEAKSVIGEQAARVLGVKEVINEAVVGPASSLSARSNDSYITSKVKARLVDEKNISATHIKVVTENGIVYLMGIVTDREAKVAVAVARTTEGVRKVVNVMQVMSDAEISRLTTVPTMGTSAPAQPAQPPAQPAPVESR
ncbi:MAG TPA: BON domain-containing protein [Azonexus sp.]|nr:BON domain-containing protein [Azonexus sp.]